MKRQDDELDAIFVHFRQAQLFEIEQTPLDIRPGGKPTGIPRVMSLIDRIWNGKMFFESDLPFHGSPSYGSFASFGVVSGARR